jgi:spore coat polysaccharide biosynthesis protein SpsF
MTRRLVAALACRATGTRLYGKPLQNLEAGHSILDHIIAAMSATPEIAMPVLGIAEGVENLAFEALAERKGLTFIRGDEKNVVMRLIQCGRAGDATDVFRITSECPFTAWELVAETWRRHVVEENEITVTDLLPLGMHFEIYKLSALDRIQEEGEDSERSEYVSNYPRRCPERFRLGFVAPPAAWQRSEFRLTVDYPEDLVLCRKVYEALKDSGPRIPTGEIVAWLDAHPKITDLVTPYVYGKPIWEMFSQNGQEEAV